MPRSRITEEPVDGQRSAAKTLAAAKKPTKKSATASVTKKATPTKASAKKAAPAKTTAKKATPKKASATKAAPAKATAKKATAKKATPKKASATKAAPAKKSPPTKAPAAKKAVVKKAPDKFMLQQRDLLLKEREEHMEQFEAFKAEADQLAREMEPGDSDFGEEGGEGGTLSIDRERDLALSAQTRAVIDEIDDALVKIDNGVYGACENCAKPIVKDRLRALPYARLCISCKQGGLRSR